MKLHEIADILDWTRMYAATRSLALCMAYGGIKELQTRVDEEGCGAVFAAVADLEDRTDWRGRVYPIKTPSDVYAYEAILQEKYFSNDEWLAKNGMRRGIHDEIIIEK